MFQLLWKFPETSAGLVIRQLSHLRKQRAVILHFYLTVADTAIGVHYAICMALT